MVLCIRILVLLSHYTILCAIHSQASTLTQHVTGHVGPVTPSIYWSCKIFTGCTIFSLTLQEKTLHEIHQQHLFLFTLSSFISKTFGYILEGKLVDKNVRKCLLALLMSSFTSPKLFWGYFTGLGPAVYC